MITLAPTIASSNEIWILQNGITNYYWVILPVHNTMCMIPTTSQTLRQVN